MADITKSQHNNQVVEEDDHLIPSQQTLNPISSNSFQEDDDDLVNIEDEYVPYTFTLDPFNSSFFIPSSSHHHHHSCSSDSTVYPDSLYAHDHDDADEYDQMDFITDLFDSSQQIHDDGFVSNNIDQFGLRVVGIESDSDTEQFARLDHDSDDFDTARVDEQDGLIDEISVSSEGDAALEWEILLAVNNLERDIELETDGFVYTPEFDTLIGHFVETVRALRGTPPAAKSIVDNLPLVVVLNKGDDDDEICAVCKDEICVDEKVRQLPCRHHYHGECIIPWLSIRNTCPVCRFELPTDDVDYERSKNRMNDDELRVGYDFQLSP